MTTKNRERLTWYLQMPQNTQTCKTMHFNLYLPSFAHELKANTTTNIEKLTSPRECEGKITEEQQHLSVTVSYK